METVKKLIKLKFKLSLVVLIYFIIGVVIVAIITTIYWNLSKKVDDIKTKYGDEVKAVDDIKIKLNEASEQFKSLQEKIELGMKTRQEIYFGNLTNNILGYYGTWNMKTTKPEMENVKIAVRYSFSCSETLFKKGEVKNYAPTIRTCALRQLAQIRPESDFNPDLIHQNYFKDIRGNYVCKKQGRKVYTKNGNLSIWYISENGKEYEATSYVCKDYYIKTVKYNDTKIKWVYYGKDENDKKEFYKFADIIKMLYPTTKDYGLCQDNDCNWPWVWSKLYSLSLWNQKMDRWALDPEMNIYGRILIDESRIIMKFDKAGAGHWDLNFLNMLTRVDGWQEIYE